MGHPFQVLGYLFSRLGSDCGRIMKGMHDARVSWGTYQDEICIDASQWHCNAHANNVVILAEGSSPEMFLGWPPSPRRCPRPRLRLRERACTFRCVARRARLA